MYQNMEKTMNVVVLRGTLSSEPMEVTLPSGTNIMNWNVTTETSDGKRSVPVQWVGPTKRVRDFAKGDDVVVLGAIRRRFFRSGGSTAARTEVLASSVAKPTQAVAVSRLLARARNDIEC